MTHLKANRTRIATCCLAAAMLAAIGACTEVDSESIVPHFSAITCEPQHPAPGDSVTLTAVQDQVGHLINATTYTWELTYTQPTMADTTVTISNHIVYDLEGGNANPQVGFRIPADTPGRYLHVTLRATYSLSGQDRNGAIYGSATRSTDIVIQ